jgi:hypothetical protein
VATSRRPSIPWPGRLQLVLGALVLVAVAFLADWWQANREMDRLLDEVEASEGQVAAAVENLEYTIRFSTLAGLDPDATEEVREAARVEAARRLAVASARAAQAVQEAGTDVQEVGILPWHGSLRDARAAYVEHNAAWVSVFVAGATEPARLVDPALGEEVRATSSASKGRLEDARPVWARHDAGDRIARIFRETRDPFS